MKQLMPICLIAVLASCKSPNDAASTRVSTAPMSNDPSTTMPGTGAKRPYSPTSQEDSAHMLSPDSTSVILKDSLNRPK